MGQLQGRFRREARRRGPSSRTRPDPGGTGQAIIAGTFTSHAVPARPLVGQAEGAGIRDRGAFGALCDRIANDALNAGLRRPYKLADQKPRSLLAGTVVAVMGTCAPFKFCSFAVAPAAPGITACGPSLRHREFDRRLGGPLQLAQVASSHAASALGLGRDSPLPPCLIGSAEKSFAVGTDAGEREVVFGEER